MLEHKGKRNDSLVKLQDVNVAIISLNPQLGSQSYNRNLAMQGRKHKRLFFQSVGSWSVCHLARLIYSKCGVFLNLKINIFPLKDSYFFKSPVPPHFVPNADGSCWELPCNAGPSLLHNHV